MVDDDLERAAEATVLAGWEPRREQIVPTHSHRAVLPPVVAAEPGLRCSLDVPGTVAVHVLDRREPTVRFAPPSPNGARP